MKELLHDIQRVLTKDDLPRILRCMLIAVKEEIEIEKNCRNNRELNLEKAHNLVTKTKFVHLGCGKHIIQGYINIDVVSPADIQWDIRNDLPFCDNSIKRIFTEHVLEHLDYPISVNTILKEAYRVLEKDGELIIGVPDCNLPIHDICTHSEKNMNIAKQRWYANRPDVATNMITNLDYLNYVMRDQLFHAKYHPHYWGYNEENLTLLLKNSGFNLIEKWQIESSIINPKREWGTLYLRAEK